MTSFSKFFIIIKLKYNFRNSSSLSSLRTLQYNLLLPLQIMAGAFLSFFWQGFSVALELGLELVLGYQTGLELKEIWLAASASWVLEFKTCSKIMAWFFLLLLLNIFSYLHVSLCHYFCLISLFFCFCLCLSLFLTDTDTHMHTHTEIYKWIFFSV